MKQILTWKNNLHARVKEALIQMRQKQMHHGKSQRLSLANRTRIIMSTVVIISVLASLTVIVGLTRTWMIRQIDQALDTDIVTLIETHTPGQPLHNELAIPATVAEPQPVPHRGKHRDAHRAQREKFHESDGVLFFIATTNPNHSQGVILQRFTAHPLNPTDTTAILDHNTQTHHYTLDLPHAGQYRALTRTHNGTTYTVGRGTDNVNDIIETALLPAGAIILIAVIAVSLASGRWIRKELQPLESVVDVSRHVSQALETTHSPGSQRVHTENLPENSEVSEVAHALNALIDSVHESLETKERSIEQLRQFVADASHELRTPLASIKGYTQLLEQGATDPTRALERISAESTRMSALVEDLLLLARLDAGRELTHQTIDLLPIAIESLADANAAAPSHQWNLNLPNNPQDGCLVEGDERALRQIIANLLANARHHTPPGTTITLSITPSSEHVALTISDDGPGIPPEIHNTLFDRFVRGDASRSRDNGGSSGLGLAIVQALTTQMGGKVSVDSAPGRGAAFRVEFPGLSGS